MRCMAFGCCVLCGRPYKDSKFPANSQSIGLLEGKSSLQQIDAEIGWERVAKVCVGGGQGGAKLFAGGIQPGDICQGQLGDCWLMSALACLAHEEGAIQNVFLTDEYNSYGCYKLKLFDKPANKKVTVVIDDMIPVKKGTCNAIFAKPQGEAWVVLLEKALAKFKGSYNALDGGSILWAFECLTGDYVFKFQRDKASGSWKRFDLVHPKEKNGNCMLQPSSDILKDNEMFQCVAFYTRKKSVIGASSGGGTDSENIDGIVQGHAYSVIDAKEVDGYCLVQLRNPWGSFEWKGDWSDTSGLWKQYPKVARACRFIAADDGMFWMEWKDFVKYYSNLDFCYRTTGFDDIQLDRNEEYPVLGPAIGCVSGCWKYWCCCLGVNALFFSNRTQVYEKYKTGSLATVDAC